MAEKNKARKKLAIIDGKSVFYRGYYAMPNLSTKDGTPTGGIYGFAAMSLELIKRLKPDYVAVAWDKPKTNIRRRLELYPEYKAGRKPAPADFYAQIPILHELLEAFGWPLYEFDDYEADDIMGTMATAAAKKDIETLLITSDLDMLQLVDPHINVYALKKGLTNIELFKPEYIEEKYGIKATQLLDLKALKGDSSDNIPGVPGIGEKTAIELLKQYTTLDGIYENIELTKESTRKKLEAGKDLAYLSKEIGRIWLDAPMELDFKAMDVNKLDTHELKNILQNLEFKSLLRHLPEYMQNVPDESGGTTAADNSELQLAKNQVIDSDKKLGDVELSGAEQLVVHSRSAGKHGRDPQVLIISPNPKTVYTIEINKVNPKKLGQLLSTISQLPLVGHDLKSDIKSLKSLEVEGLKVKHDVLIGGFLVNPLSRAQSITDLAVEMLGFEGSPLENIPTEDFISRAPELAAIIWGLYSQQSKDLQQYPKVDELGKTVEWPVIPVLAVMEYEGIKLNCKYLNDFSVELEGAIGDIEQQIYGYADSEFNVGSPGQLAEILFEKLKLPTAFIKKGKTGYSTAASELDKLRDKHPIIDLITTFRENTKLKNTYVDTLPKMVDDQSRVHTTFNMTIASTGRLSSVDPNLQNIPVRTDLGKRIRTAFIADKGNVLVSADYSQFELRLASVLADDKDMMSAFNDDIDIHVATAAAVNGIDIKDVTKQQRYNAKAVNFGILYGQGPHGLAQGTGMDFKAAKEFIDRYFEIRPKLKQYINDTRKKAQEEGYVETMLGRRRPTPDVHSSNFVVREAAYRAAINLPVQGTAADLTKLAMIEVAKKLPADCKMLLQIHDSILVECSEKSADSVGKILKETMENVYKLPVKLKVDISSGENWGNL